MPRLFAAQTCADMDVDEVKLSLAVIGAARRHGDKRCQPGVAMPKFRLRFKGSEKEQYHQKDGRPRPEAHL